jgi:hypothetical protein
MDKLNTFDWVAFGLVIVGGLNWLLVGLFEFDLVAELFGEGAGFTRVVYTLVGLSAIYLLVSMVGRSGRKAADK